MAQKDPSGSLAQDFDLVQVGGVIRFSFPCDGGFKKKFTDTNHQLETLFAEDRMEMRFRLFENLCLHTLKHQTNPNFKIGIVVGTDMPARYLDRLNNAIKDLPQAQIISFPIITHREAMQLAFDQLFDHNIPFKFGFRLDDDDAVAVNYIQTLFEMAPGMLAVTNGTRPIVASFPKGVTVYGAGETQLLVPSQMPAPPSAGMAVLTKTDWHHNMYRFPHHKISTLQTTLSNPAEFMYLRMIHDSNDSDHPIPKLTIDMSDEEIDTVLQRKFALTLDALKGL